MPLNDPSVGLTRREALRVGAASLAGLRLTGSLGSEEPSKPLRAGIIGLDTSHVVAFTKVLNTGKSDLGVRVVAAYPAGTDIPASKNRVEGFTKTLRETYAIDIVGSIDALLPKVDVVLLESVDGRPHLEQVRPVFKANKPVFIDKPVAATLADAIQIFDLARDTKTPCFSSSSLRFAPGVQELRNSPKIGDVLGCDAYGPCPIESYIGDLFWYGIHGVELLFTLMGTGCESVTRVHSKDVDKVVGVWKGGRIGSFRGIRAGKSDYGAVVFGSKGVAPSGGSGGYEPLLVEICKFFKTGKPPVSAEETLNLIAFMEAADESKKKDGAAVAISDLMARAAKG